MSFDPSAAEVFRYESVSVDPDAGMVVCRYRLDGWRFEERITFPSPPAGGERRWDTPQVDEAARLLFLLAGVSYYKTAAPAVIEVGELGLTGAEERLLRSFYVDGLGEYAYRNDLDLAGVRIEAGRRDPPRVGWSPAAGRPLIPFGGGIDSIVTAESVRARSQDPALFVVGMGGTRFAAIEDAAAVTGLPVVRADRQLDPKVLDAARLRMNFRNGHVPVTGVISAIAITAAALDGRDAVVMSNESSASAGNVEVDGRVVNHQWSKSWSFEQALRGVLDENLGPAFHWFSLLRPFSELWVAARMARLDAYLPVFRSCNRAFHIDPATRLDRWCGACDKCAFIDLILAPFLPAATLDAVFAGAEPLTREDLTPMFRRLVGLSPDAKPFECVGDVDECRVAAVLASARHDRGDNRVLAALAREITSVDPVLDEPGGPGLEKAAERLLRPLGEHAIPEQYAPDDLVD